MAPNFSLLLGVVDFSLIVPALLSVGVLLVLVYSAQVGAKKLLGLIGGGRVFYAGRFWDRDVYENAMSRVQQYKKRGGTLDKETARHYSSFMDKRARRGLLESDTVEDDARDGKRRGGWYSAEDDARDGKLRGGW